MVKSAYVKDFTREIKKTFSRFLSITLLLMLAVGFFSGLRVTKPDMQLTADKYMDMHGMYDIKVLSTLGLTKEDVTAVSLLNGVDKAVGLYQFDVITEAADKDIVVTVQCMSDTGINTPELLSGRMPEAENECVAEERLLTVTGLGLGDTLVMKETSEGFTEALKYKEFTIVGTVRSPLFMTRFQRGTSVLGSGEVEAYLMIPDDAVDLEYYTEIDVAVTKAIELTAFTQEYDEAVQAVSEQLEALEITRAPIRYNEVRSEAEQELNDAKTELDDKKAELLDAKTELEEGKTALLDGRKELADAKETADRKLAEAHGKLEDAAQEIDDGYQELRLSEEELAERESAGREQLEAGFSDLERKKTQLNEAWDEYQTNRAAFDQQLTEWEALPESVRKTMPEKAAEIEAAKSRLDAAEQELQTQQAALDTGFYEANAQKAEFENGIADAKKQIEEGYQALAEAEEELAAGWKNYNREKERAEQDIREAEQKLTDVEAEIADGEAEIIDAEAKISEAEEELKRAEADIADIPEGEWFVTDRSMNEGYNSFSQDADRMGALGNVFPAIFFAVAALVCLTTMTRMVDEKRIEIGTYKALGHRKLTTTGKFLFYSLFAAVLGTVGGLLLGMAFLPRFIFKAYSILYDTPPLQTPLRWGTGLISAAAAMICTVGATMFACINTLREMPASLLRPRAPVPGKRVFMEYITPLWKRMSFFAKVSARNIFRYKKRLIMTIIGIAGCTALIVTGFGLRDSIIDITDLQFKELFRYDLLVYLQEEAEEGQLEELRSVLGNHESVSGYVPVGSVSADFKGIGGIESGYVMIPEKPAELDAFITLRHRIDKTPVTLPEEGAVITEKLAERLGLQIGDTLTIDTEGVYTVKVADIVENYVFHYVYMSPSYYKQVFGTAAEINQILVACSDSAPETANAVSSALLKLGAVSYVSYFKSIADSFKDSMNSINYVVWIILLSAALLALIVLYNLANINITERKRELATIKVLGFYNMEVSRYIFRENTILTIIGTVLGLIAGRFLHAWLVRSVELNFVMFAREARPLSYAAAALLTFVFAVAVNIIGHRHIKRINMVESLKTNE
jgi:putative ABC transport system permease protein